MSVHVYPYTYQFKNHRGAMMVRTVLVLTTHSRSGDWTLKVKGDWESDWRTVVNVTKTFPTFLGDRENVGGVEGYSRNEFFWNLMRWTFVSALKDYHVHHMEDELDSLAEKAKLELHKIPSPDQVDGTYDYIGEMERILSPLRFKVLSESF